VLLGVRVSRIEPVGRAGELSTMEAGEPLGMLERRF
jgi:hypothetical protein